MTMKSSIRAFRDTFDDLAAAFETDPVIELGSRLAALEREVRRLAAAVDERAAGTTTVTKA